MGRKVARETAALMVQRYVPLKCSTWCKSYYFFSSFWFQSLLVTDYHHWVHLANSLPIVTIMQPPNFLSNLNGEIQSTNTFLCLVGNPVFWFVVGRNWRTGTSWWRRTPRSSCKTKWSHCCPLHYLELSTGVPVRQIDRNLTTILLMTTVVLFF